MQVVVPLTAGGPTSAVEALLAAGIDGVCCYNDEVAIAILAGARALGVKIPNQMAVIGVDDDPISALVVPALTTVRMDVEANAVLIANVLRANIEGKNVTREATGPRGFVVVRDSA
jgi:DNA-binding LacI/PurR family transcriptional regulator